MKWVVAPPRYRPRFSNVTVKLFSDLTRAVFTVSWLKGFATTSTLLSNTIYVGVRNRKLRKLGFLKKHNIMLNGLSDVTLKNPAYGGANRTGSE